MIRRSNSPTSTAPTLVSPSRSISVLMLAAAWRSTSGTAATAAPTRTTATSAAMTLLLHGFGVRLLRGLGRVEGRMLHAGGVDALDGRISRHVDLEARGVEDLRHQAEIGHGRLVAVAVAAGLAVLRDRGLVGVEAGLDPVARPGEGALLRLVVLVAQIGHHAQVLDGMDVGGRDQRQRPHARAADRILGQQRRIGMRLLEIFQDRHRLGQHLARIEHQRGHELLRD